MLNVSIDKHHVLLYNALLITISHTMNHLDLYVHCPILSQPTHSCFLTDFLTLSTHNTLFPDLHPSLPAFLPLSSYLFSAYCLLPALPPSLRSSLLSSLPPFLPALPPSLRSSLPPSLPPLTAFLPLSSYLFSAYCLLPDLSPSLSPSQHGSELTSGNGFTNNSNPLYNSSTPQPPKPLPRPPPNPTKIQTKIPVGPTLSHSPRRHSLSYVKMQPAGSALPGIISSRSMENFMESVKYDDVERRASTVIPPASMS